MTFSALYCVSAAYVWLFSAGNGGVKRAHKCLGPTTAEFNERRCALCC